MNRRTWIVLVLAGAAALVYLLRPSDEERVRRQVAALANAVVIDAAERDPEARPLRIQQAFRRILEPKVQVDIPDLVEDVHGRDELAGMAMSAAVTLRELTVAFDGVRVEIDPASRVARVTTVATFTGTDLEGNRGREARDVTVRLEKIDGEWKIASIGAGLGRGQHASAP